MRGGRVVGGRAFRADPNRGCGGEGTLWRHAFGIRPPGVPPGIVVSRMEAMYRGSQAANPAYVSAGEEQWNVGYGGSTCEAGSLRGTDDRFGDAEAKSFQTCSQGIVRCPLMLAPLGLDMSIQLERSWV